MKYKNKKESNLGGIIAIVAIVAFIGAALYVGSRGSADGGAAAGVFSEMTGKQAPKFALKDKDGNEYTNSNLKGKKVVLFFNEGIMCYPACWREMYALSQYPDLKNDDVVVLSVVVDTKAAWDRAITRMPELAAARVVYDEDRSVSGAFGVLTLPSSMHYGSLPGHTYVVLDKQGKIVYTYDDPRMSPNGALIAEELKKI